MFGASGSYTKEHSSNYRTGDAAVEMQEQAKVTWPRLDRLALVVGGEGGKVSVVSPCI